MRVIHYLQENSAPPGRGAPGAKASTPGGDNGVYVWGAAALIYYLTGRPSPSRFVPNFPLVAPWGPPAWRDELIADLQRSPPAFIVVAQGDQGSKALRPLDSEAYLKRFPALNAFISKSYERAAAFPFFVVYRRSAR